TDGTLARVEEFLRGRPHGRVVSHFRSLGIGPARNTGVKLSRGAALFFCDGDDFFYPEHVAVCWRVLSQQAVGLGRTGMHFNDPLHPYWKAAVENTSALNLCIRRECHEFVEGFPEASLYKQVGGEDVGYQAWTATFFQSWKVERETVEYVRYPGNNLDRQLQ